MYTVTLVKNDLCTVDNFAKISKANNNKYRYLVFRYIEVQTNFSIPNDRGSQFIF